MDPSLSHSKIFEESSLQFCVKVLGRVSSLDTGEGGVAPCVGVECSHERCSNMTSMYKVVKTVTSTKHRHEPFTDFYEVYEEIGR